MNNSKYAIHKKRNRGKKSKMPTRRYRIIQPERLLVNQKGEQERIQEVRKFKEAIIKLLPKDFQTVLQALVTCACLYEFLQTKDAIWLLTAYAMANGASSLPIVKTLIPYHEESLRK
jgi:hypothetical protein